MWWRADLILQAPENERRWHHPVLEVRDDQVASEKAEGQGDELGVGRGMVML